MSWYATRKASKLPSWDKSKILVFDTETTGLEPAIDEIIQITILDGCGSILFNSYIKPRHHRSWKVAEAVNHISYKKVKDAPTFSDVKEEIQELFNNATLVVGYNVNFDINFVKAAGIVVSGKIFDVMTAFASYRAAIDKPHFYHLCKLKECAQYFGHSYTPHDSAEDALVTLECFDSLIEAPRFTTFKYAEKKQLKKEHLVDSPAPKTSFTVQMPVHRRHSIAIWGILLIIVVEILIYVISRTYINNLQDYLYFVRSISSNWDKDRIRCILYVVFGIGCLSVILGLLQLIIRMPRMVIQKLKHFRNRFK